MNHLLFAVAACALVFGGYQAENYNYLTGGEALHDEMVSGKRIAYPSKIVAAKNNMTYGFGAGIIFGIAGVAATVSGRNKKA